MNGADLQAFLIQKLAYISEVEKIYSHICVFRLCLTDFHSIIILRRYLYFSLIQTCWDFTALRDQKPVPFCTSKMAQILLLTTICLNGIYGMPLIMSLAVKEAEEMGTTSLCVQTAMYYLCQLYGKVMQTRAVALAPVVYVNVGA